MRGSPGGDGIGLHPGGSFSRLGQRRNIKRIIAATTSKGTITKTVISHHSNRNCVIDPVAVIESVVYTFIYCAARRCTKNIDEMIGPRESRDRSPINASLTWGREAIKIVASQPQKTCTTICRTFFRYVERIKASKANYKSTTSHFGLSMLFRVN